MEVWVGTKGSGYDSMYMILSNGPLTFKKYYWLSSILFVKFTNLIIKLDFLLEHNQNEEKKIVNPWNHKLVKICHEQGKSAQYKNATLVKSATV